MPPIDPAIPAAASDWAQRQLGRFEVIRAYRTGSRHSGGRTTGVWLIRSERGDAYLKLHRRRGRWATEVYVYQHWAAAIEPFIPKLIGILDETDTFGILSAAIPGVPLREISPPTEAVTEIYRRAGQLLRQLHDLTTNPWFGPMDERGRPLSPDGQPTDRAPLNKADYLRDDLHALCQTADRMGCLLPHERELLSDALLRLPCYSDEPAVPSSTDFTPGNWLIDDHGRLVALIDFENMLWGSRADPFARLIPEYFPQSPEAVKAFWQGYGQDLSTAQTSQVMIVAAMYGAWHITAGTANHNEDQILRGHRILDHLQGMHHVLSP